MSAYRLRSALGALLFLITACTVQLVPPGDETLLQKLETTHEETLAFFSSLSGCPRSCAFSTHSSTYDKLIASFGAARDRAKGRPVPPLSTRLARSRLFERACKGIPPETCLNTTPEKLDAVVDSLAEMRDLHRGGPLGAGTIELYAADYTANLDSALVIESALIR